LFSLQQNQITRELNRFCPEAGGGGSMEVAQAMCTHVSKYKNDKRKKMENKRAEQVLTKGRGEVAQIIYTHVSKCKNDKKKGEEISNNDM
jgi:hypothetical protein